MSEVIVKNNEKRFQGVDGKNGPVTLKPGLNKVAQEDFDVFKNHPVLLKLVEQGKLEFIVPEEKKGEEQKEGASVEALVKLKPKDALEAIADTSDAVILTEWFAKEKRKEVKSAIEKQLAYISENPVYRSDEKKEGEE